MVVFPELAITGYPPRDLLHKSRFIPRQPRRARASRRGGRRDRRCSSATSARNERGPAARRRIPSRFCSTEKSSRRARRRCCRRTMSSTKTATSSPRSENAVVEFNGRKIGLTDLRGRLERRSLLERPPLPAQSRARTRRGGRGDPFQCLRLAVASRQGPHARAKCSPASPRRRSARSSIATPSAETTSWSSTERASSSTARGSFSRRARSFAEDFIIIDTDDRRRRSSRRSLPTRKNSTARSCSGLRDYLHKCGFKSAVLGLSGGIDSALTAVLAVEALGAGERARRFAPLAVLLAGQPR